MAISAYIPAAEQLETQTPLLEETLNSTVDYKGRPAKKPSSGRWRLASFLIAAEIAERFAYYGISSNLITYLTGPLGFPTASAAENVNAWLGTDLLLPFIGAFVAYSFLGCYRTIVVSSVIYVVVPSHIKSCCAPELEVHEVLVMASDKGSKEEIMHN